MPVMAIIAARLHFSHHVALARGCHVEKPPSLE